MARNIVKDYLEFDRRNIIKYIDIITEKKLNGKICEMIANVYMNVRYYDMYEHVKKNTISDICYYVNEKLENEYSDKSNEKNISFIKNALIIIRYIVLLEKYHDDKNILKLLTDFEGRLISEYENTKVDAEELIKTIKEDINKKRRYINGSASTDFSVMEHNTNLTGVFDLRLENTVKIPDLFSQVAINRVYNTGVINEDKMVVYYLLASREVLKDMVDFDYGKVYLLDFASDLLGKRNKLASLLKTFDLDYLKERMIIKISYQEYLDNKDHVDELIHDGLSFAIILDNDFVDGSILLDIFTYIIVSDDIDKYPMLKRYGNVIISG